MYSLITTETKQKLKKERIQRRGNVADVGPTLDPLFSTTSCGSPEPITDPATQQTLHVAPMMGHCWSTVCDAGPTLNHHWRNASYLLGTEHVPSLSRRGCRRERNVLISNGNDTPKLVEHQSWTALNTCSAAKVHTTKRTTSTGRP